MLKSPKTTKFVLLVTISTRSSMKMSKNWGILSSGGLYTPNILRKEFADVTFHLACSNSAVILCSSFFTLRFCLVTSAKPPHFYLSYGIHQLYNYVYGILIPEPKYHQHQSAKFLSLLQDLH